MTKFTQIVLPKCFNLILKIAKFNASAEKINASETWHNEGIVCSEAISGRHMFRKSSC